MRVIGSFEVKTHFSKLLAEVSMGEKLLITKNGKPVAMMIPVEPSEGLSREEAMQRLHEMRGKLSKKITLKDIHKMKTTGRKE